MRFVGLTGHHDPAILMAAMDRYAFDCVLVPVNPADPARLPFITTVIPAARARGMGVMGLADTLIIGCSSPAEIAANLHVGRTAEAMTAEERAAFERRIAHQASRYAYFKAS